MGALPFLYLTRLKNGIKELFKKPEQLFYVLFLLALAVFSLTMGKAGAAGGEYRDLKELIALTTAVYILMFLMIVQNGFSRGGFIFTMSDVNLIFTAPLSHTRVLFYGLFRQINTSLLIGLIILFQFGLLSRTYGVSYTVLFCLFLGYVVTVFLGQITVMTIYVFTSTDELLRKCLKTLFWLLTGILLLYIGLYVWQQAGEGVLPAAVTAVNSSIVRCFPVGGWLGWSFAAVVGEASFIPGIFASLVWLVLLVSLISLTKQNWYEDVLETAELTQSIGIAQKAGNMEAAPGKVRIGKSGLDKGWGASTFYYKHKIENRRGKAFLLDRNALAYAAIIIIIALFMVEGGIVAIFSCATYMQLFSSGLGRINKEFSKPFVYLVPEPPFTKLVQNLREMLPGALVEAVVIFIPIGLILGLSGVDTCAAILARVSFALLFAAGNIIVKRFLGGASKLLTLFFYFIVMLVLAAPGIVLAVLISFQLVMISQNVTVLLVIALANIPVFLLVLFLCRNMLEYAELN